MINDNLSDEANFKISGYVVKNDKLTFFWSENIPRVTREKPLNLQLVIFWDALFLCIGPYFFANAAIIMMACGAAKGGRFSDIFFCI